MTSSLLSNSGRIHIEEEGCRFKNRINKRVQEDEQGEGWSWIRMLPSFCGLRAS